jgi:putative ABC transport system ATP-binding protein
VLPGAAVAARGLVKRYAANDAAAVVALDGVDVTTAAGTMLAIMGPSGSGKSTLLHLIGAMDSADAGSIKVGDFEVTELSPAARPAYRRRIGFVFQRFQLLPALSTVDNVAAPLLPYRVDFNKHDRARELLAAVGLERRADALPSELSGGQQQRVAIARALIGEPILVLADEPTGNLDSQTGAEIVDLLRSICDERRTTVLVATHDDLVAARCDCVVRLRDGRVRDETEVVRSAHPEQLLERISRIDI